MRDFQVWLTATKLTAYAKSVPRIQSVSEWKWTCAYAERSAPIPGGQTAAKMAKLDALECNIEPSPFTAGDAQRSFRHWSA